MGGKEEAIEDPFSRFEFPHSTFPQSEIFGEEQLLSAHVLSRRCEARAEYHYRYCLYCTWYTIYVTHP